MSTNGETQQDELQVLYGTTDASDSTPVRLVCEYSEIDARGALAFRLRFGDVVDMQVMDFDPGGESRGGKWIRAKSHLYDLPKEATALEVRVQADKLCWSERSNVYSISNEWKDMTFHSKTAKQLIITREQLQEHIVVFGVWYGATKGEEDVDQQQQICGTLKLKNIYDDDDDDDDDDEDNDTDEAPFLSGTVAFFMNMVRSDTSDSSMRTIAFPERDVNCKATTRHVL